MRKPVIICVDDEPTILDSLKIELKKALGDGYLIEIAEGGEEGLEVVEELIEDGYDIALIISDYIMPDMKGDEFLKRIHAILPKTLKVMLTGQADLQAVANAVNFAKLYRYLTKPWQSEDLILTVKEAVRSYLQDKKIAEKNAKLAEYNQKLEELVRIRTRELEEKNQHLEQEICDRQQAQQALQESEAELRALFKAMTEVIMVFNAEGKCLKVAPTNPNLLYKPAKEHSGKTLHQLLPLERANLFLSYIREAIDTQQTLNVEYNLTVDDSEICFSANISPISSNSAIWVARDITDRKHREQALRLIVEGTASKTGSEFFRSCVRYLAEVLQVRYAFVAEWGDREQKRVRTLAFWTGDNFRENFEYDLTGTPCNEIILTGKMHACFDNLQSYFSEDKALIELNAQSYVGMPIVDAAGHLLGHLAVMDVKPMEPDETRESILKIFAARTGAELERKLTEEALQKSVYAADAANRAKSEFLSKMSHELRTPLNAILGFTQLMNRDPMLSGEQQEQLGIINRSGEHLLTLINDILEMSKIEAGKLTLNETSFDLHRLLETLEEMLQFKAKSKGLQFVFECSPEVPRHIKTDESKLRQVLINLLGNAIKFTEKGRVTLRVGVAKGQLLRTYGSETAIANEQLAITFKIEDTGLGIAAEEMNLLFAPFSQTETGRKSEQGTGLGLPISQQFVQLMGGEIAVSSNLGIGTLFKFEIPLRIADTEEVQIPEESRRVMSLAPNQPPSRILVVDDLKVSRLVLVKLLSCIGFEVREAVNGLEAIAIWESWQPHLILMDIQMPLMDGYEATQRIKAACEGNSPAIVALTANAFEEERIAILSAGCDDFISKPFSEGVILNKIAQYIGVRYIYEQEPMEKQADNQPDSDDEVSGDRPIEAYLSQMPAEWVMQLYQAATQCSDDLIFPLLEQIPEESSPLANSLKEWANDFRFDKVIDLIQHAKV